MKSRSKHCLIDLSDVAFMDSTGLAALLRLRQRLAPWSLVLLAPSVKALRILRRFQLEDSFHIAPTILEAREFIVPPEPAIASPFANPVPPLLWTGEVTAANAEDVWTATRAKIDLLCAAGEVHPSIDLSELRFIDSTGVGFDASRQALCPKPRCGPSVYQPSRRRSQRSCAWSVSNCFSSINEHRHLHLRHPAGADRHCSVRLRSAACLARHPR
jgi:anti-anti-sigma regulatory factor